mmetsp:Transcript_59097/g.170818  ORF Transcript_59097/g.170818 Transcript_59097/m.170818 type:complete len:246 (-) Transcript_59097:102-839(-)
MIQLLDLLRDHPEFGLYRRFQGRLPLSSSGLRSLLLSCGSFLLRSGGLLLRFRRLLLRRGDALRGCHGFVLHAFPLVALAIGDLLKKRYFDFCGLPIFFQISDLPLQSLELVRRRLVFELHRRLLLSHEAQRILLRHADRARLGNRGTTAGQLGSYSSPSSIPQGERFSSVRGRLLLDLFFQGVHLADEVPLEALPESSPPCVSMRQVRGDGRLSSPASRHMDVAAELQDIEWIRRGDGVELLMC